MSGNTPYNPFFNPGQYGQHPSGTPYMQQNPQVAPQVYFQQQQQMQQQPSAYNVGAPPLQYSSHGQGAPGPQAQYRPPVPVMPQQMGQGPDQNPNIPQNAIIPGSQVEALMSNLMGSVQQMSEKLQGLELQYNALMGNMSGPDLKVKFPPQMRAGVIDYPDLLPYPFFYGIYELTEGVGDNPFGTTANPSSVDIPLDTIYTYFTNVDFYLLRTARPDDSDDVLFTWLPRSAINSPYLPTGGAYQGFDFLFDIKAVSNGINWSSGQMPSAILDMQLGKGWELPIEYHAKNKDSMRITAQPLVAAPTDYEYRLFTGIWGYQLRSRRG